MIEKTAKPGAANSPEDFARSVNDEKVDPVFEIGPIGVHGEPSLEEWYALRGARFDELRRFSIPQNLVNAVHDFKPHASVTWLNDKGTAAGPDDVLVEPVIGETPPKLPAPVT